MVSYPKPGEGFIRPHDLVNHLFADVEKSFEILDSDRNSQYLRRNVVRNIFFSLRGLFKF